MATTRKIEMKFGTSEGGTMTLGYNYASSSITSQKVLTAMNAIITNGSIFKLTPITKKSARLIVTDTEDIDITEGE